MRRWFILTSLPGLSACSRQILTAHRHQRGHLAYFGYIRSSTKNFEIYEFDVDWTTPSNSSFTLVNTLSPATYNSNLNGVPQPEYYYPAG